MNWSKLESFMTDGIAVQGKQIDIIMRQKTADRYSHAMAVENAVGLVEWMEENKKIDCDTAKNLITMLRSEDVDNFNIAILAIQQL